MLALVIATIDFTYTKYSILIDAEVIVRQLTGEELPGLRISRRVDVLILELIGIT